jgi:hypothetical protein
MDHRREPGVGAPCSSGGQSLDPRQHITGLPADEARRERTDAKCPPGAAAMAVSSGMAEVGQASVVPAA